MIPFQIGAQVACAGGQTAQVLHTDGDYAILQQGDAFSAVQGGHGSFKAVAEVSHTLFGAMQQITEAKAKKAPKRGA